MPGVNPQGRFTLADRLPLAGRHRRHGQGDVHGSTSSTPVNNVVAGTLTVTPTGGASCSTLTGPTLTSADDDIASIADPVVYEWTCTVAAGATPGSLTFSDSRDRRAARSTFPTATSNSVLVSPPLTFTRDRARSARRTRSSNQALLAASGETASSPPVPTSSARRS